MLRLVTVSRADLSEPYRILGVSPSASAADVRRAFRTLVRQFHPDANPSARPGTELNTVVGAYRRLGRLGVLAGPAPEPAAAPAAEPLRHIDVYA